MKRSEIKMNYPLMNNAADQLRTSAGRNLSEVTLDAVANDMLSADDIRIDAATLRAQAEIAREAGYPQLADNLTRAAELTAVPNEEMLHMYEQLRPGRASFAEMMSLAERLEAVYHAIENAQLVREAATVYQKRGLLKRKSGTD